MSNRCLTLIREGLLSVGFREDRLKSDVPVPEDATRKIGLVAYRDAPFDARTSAMAAFDGAVFKESDFRLFKPTCASILAHCHEDHVLFWKQAVEGPHFIERVPAGRIASFFQKHHDKLSPDALYRAKVWGRMEENWQNDFVDIGLLPVMEQEAGEKLRELLERAVTATKLSLEWGTEMSDADGCWLLKAVFWLLAAKILRDKGVPGFIRMDLSELETVYLKLAKHYNKHHPQPVQIDGSQRRDALLKAAAIIQAFGHCGAVTTESLARVYESALITHETRKELGTHSTPTWLVDDIVARLRPWIEQMPVSGRQVFEPACGHAGFLISAMRLLSELLPEDQIENRKAYLRQRLHGIEVDSFAYEVAKLSLTLADVPNDNGWMLDNANMFSGDALATAVSKANIVLANPPFEKFGDARPEGAIMFNRADETFWQIVENLPIGGIFGIVMPQTILHSTQGKKLRQKLLDEYEISEVTLFADKVFNYGEPETAVILGRRIGSGAKLAEVFYRRVREDQIGIYKTTLTPSSLETFPRTVFANKGSSFLIPELSDIWLGLHLHSKLKDFVKGGKGFEHKGADDPTLPKGAIRELGVCAAGLVEGFAGWRKDQLTHELPDTKWLNLDAEVIGAKRHGMIIGQPQMILNYARVSRDAWRLKGLMDLKGHPVTSDFNVFRLSKKGLSLGVLWACLNSPVANAYAYTHSTKRHVLTGRILQLPVFSLDAGNLEPLETAVSAYFAAAKGSAKVDRTGKTTSGVKTVQLGLGLSDEEASESQTPEEELKYLHWRIDAEVLRLYDLPARVERRILDLFTGVPRRGVPFVQHEYFPKDFDALDRLSDLLAITADWTKTNRRRAHLIRKDVKEKLSDEETLELQNLEHLADARIALMDLQYPSVPDEVDKTVERLKREGRWVE